jgi:hypothetical protein
MKRSDIKELYYITHIENLTSILKLGILCNNKAKNFIRKSIADPEIQKRRDKAVIPGGKRKLHDYANLYFNPRNPMMFKRKDMHRELVVLRIDSTIFNEPGVVISDCNASSDYVRFYASPEGLDYLDNGLIFAEYWTDSDPIAAYKRKSVICAEVLVPDFVSPRFISGIYVSCEETHKIVVDSLEGSLIVGNVRINPKLFFL